jgi:hypothetical protein
LSLFFSTTNSAKARAAMTPYQFIAPIQRHEA